MSDKDLSIIIVNYKSWVVLSECLDSFNQYKPKLNYEIIVVDNDSKDGKLVSYSQRYPQVNFIQNSGNNGFSNGCNLGTDNSCGEYLLFLNPDTILTNNTTIDDMLDFAKSKPNIGITSCRRINSKGKPEREMTFFNPWLTIGWIRTFYKLINKSNIQKMFPENNMVWYPDWVAGSVILIQSKLFKRIGKWKQEDFWMYYEDVDLCKAVRAQDKEVALLRSSELKHVHGGSSRRNPKTTAITKSEVVASCHVYIQLHTKGVNRVALHTIILIETILSQILRIFITLPVFWKSIFKINILVFFSTLMYYINTLINGDWRSKRLKKNGA